MAADFIAECLSKDIFLKIRKYIYITLGTSKSWAFFLIGFRSRIKEKNQVEGGDNREHGISLMEEKGF